MSDQPKNDIQWMNRLREHDADAFTEIYNAYWEKLLAIAYNRLSDLQAAEDIVQDVFASLWHHREDAAITNAGAYLATAVKYKILDRARREKLLRQYQQLYGATVPLAAASPEASLQYKHIQELYQREVNNLPEKCQLIFRYSREQGMPVKKIAQELNISPKTVENQITKALHHLKDSIRSLFVSLFL